MVYVVETQESLQARPKALFVFGAIPHRSYWCRQHVCAHLHINARGKQRKGEWEENQMEHGRSLVSNEPLCDECTFCSSSSSSQIEDLLKDSSSDLCPLFNMKIVVRCSFQFTNELHLFIWDIKPWEHYWWAICSFPPHLFIVSCFADHPEGVGGGEALLSVSVVIFILQGI